MGEKHSHSDFQGGRRHDQDRRHQGGLSPELHQNQAPRMREIRDGVPARRVAEIIQLDPDRTQALEDYKNAIEAIPVEQLIGHQFEVRNICAECKGFLRHPMDGHHHGVADSDGSAKVICCKCLFDMRGLECPDSWTKIKHLRERISDIAAGIEDRRFYWVCLNAKCGHKWRNKESKAHPCRECGSKKVKGVSVKKEKLS